MIDLSSVDVLDLLAEMDVKNVRLTSGGTEANFSCFTGEHAHGDEKPSAYMNVESTAWWCFGCHARGNAISFVADVKQISVSDAQRWIRDRYGIEFMEPKGGSMVGEVEAIVTPPAPLPIKTRPSTSWLTVQRVDWQNEHQAIMKNDWALYLFKRGFTAETLESWEAGYEYQCDRITFPIYDLDGDLVGIKGRAYRPDHQPKYWVVGDVDPQRPRFGFHPHDASTVVYGLERNRGHRVGVLNEGEFNAWACSQVGIARPVALGMSYMSLRHVELLARELDEIVLVQEAGKAGFDFVWGARDNLGRPRLGSDGRPRLGAADLLEPYMNVRIARCGDEDPADLLRQGRSSEIIELIAGAPTSLELRTLFA